MLCVEPWAEEFEIQPGEASQVVVIHPWARAVIDLEADRDRLTVFVNVGGATYEFWRYGVMEFSTPIPIPGAPHWSEPE